jgi:transposase
MSCGARSLVLKYHSEGFSVRQIAAKIAELGRKYHFTTIHRLIKKHPSGLLTPHAPRRVSAGRPSAASQELFELIEGAMSDDNSLTSQELCVLAQNTLGETVTQRAMRHYRSRLGWYSTAAKYCQLIRLANRPIRVQWCEKMIAHHRRFHHSVFSDECTVAMENTRRKLFAKRGETLITLRGRPKHPFKLHVWAGISYWGATPIVVFDGKVRMNRELVKRIVEEHYLPWMHRV